jgi:hypothetical protein
MSSRIALLIFSIALGALLLALVVTSPDPMPSGHRQMLDALVALFAASGLSFLAINSVQKS